MSKSKERTVLWSVWFFFFILNLGIIMILYLQGYIEGDNLSAGFKQLNMIYGPYIGAITLFYWGSARGEKISLMAERKTTFVIALICSLLWNALILIFLLPPLLGTGGIETSLQNIKDIVPVLSWLVAGAVGYYFADPGSG